MKLNEKSLAMWATSSSPVDKEGHLIKRGEMNKQFQRRWFVLKGNLLFYFSAQTDRDPIGVIILEEHSVAMSDSRDTKYAFDLIFTAPAARVYTLAAESEALAMAWMRAIAHASFAYLRVMVEELQNKVDRLTEQSRRDTGIPMASGDRGSVSSCTSRDSRRGVAASVRSVRPSGGVAGRGGGGGGDHQLQIPGAAAGGGAPNFLSPHRPAPSLLTSPVAGGDGQHQHHQRAAISTVHSTALAVGHTTSTGTSLLDPELEESSGSLEKSSGKEAATATTTTSSSPPPVPTPYREHRDSIAGQLKPKADGTHAHSSAPPPSSSTATGASASTSTTGSEHPLLMRGTSTDTNPVLMPTTSGHASNATPPAPHYVGDSAPQRQSAGKSAALPSALAEDDPLLAGAIAAAIASTGDVDDGDDVITACHGNDSDAVAAAASNEEPTEEELLKQLSFRSMHNQSFLADSPASARHRQRGNSGSTGEDLF